ncbi:MAG TPA: hypothetical protein PLX85_05285 [Dehalococcoidia bacterium]|nr:hypothetical protein [Dehalococcoidia bacterium]
MTTATFVCWTTERRDPAALGALLIARELHARIHGHRCRVVDVEPMSDGSVRVTGYEVQEQLWRPSTRRAQTFRADERVTIHRPVYVGDRVAVATNGCRATVELQSIKSPAAAPTGVLVDYGERRDVVQPDTLSLDDG